MAKKKELEMIAEHKFYQEEQKNTRDRVLGSVIDKYKTHLMIAAEAADWLLGENIEPPTIVDDGILKSIGTRRVTLLIERS